MSVLNFISIVKNISPIMVLAVDWIIIHFPSFKNI